MARLVAEERAAEAEGICATLSFQPLTEAETTVILGDKLVTIGGGLKSRSSLNDLSRLQQAVRRYHPTIFPIMQL